MKEIHPLLRQTDEERERDLKQQRELREQAEASGLIPRDKASRLSDFLARSLAEAKLQLKNTPLKDRRARRALRDRIKFLKGEQGIK